MIEDYLTQSQRPSLDVDSPGSWIQPNIQIGESQVRKPDGREVKREFDTVLCCSSNAVFKFGLSIYKPTRIDGSDAFRHQSQSTQRNFVDLVVMPSTNLST